MCGCLHFHPGELHASPANNNNDQKVVKMPEVISGNAETKYNLSVKILTMFLSSGGIGWTLEICPKGVLRVRPGNGTDVPGSPKVDDIVDGACHCEGGARLCHTPNSLTHALG